MTKEEILVYLVFSVVAILVLVTAWKALKESEDHFHGKEDPPVIEPMMKKGKKVNIDLSDL